MVIRNPLDKIDLNWDCLVDTGADTSILSSSVADLTGHDLKADGVREEITLGVGDIHRLEAGVYTVGRAVLRDAAIGKGVIP